MSSEAILHESDTCDSGHSSRSASTRCVDESDSVGDERYERTSEHASEHSDSERASEHNDSERAVSECENIAVDCGVKCDRRETKRKICCGDVGQCAWGVLFIMVSVTGFIFSPMDFMLWEKLNMRPGLPPYEWWADPPDEVRLRAYVFNVTNHQRFLQGLDPKMNVEEIGPIVYLEKLLHSGIRFNENSTMTYTARRVPIFLPDENTVDLNATLIVPNMAVLGLSSYLHSHNYLVRTGFRFLVSSTNSQMFSKKTIYEYLWDFRDPVLDASKTIVPGLVPVNNMGILARVYSDFTDEMTVKIGPRWGHEQFFQINRFRGQPQIPGYDPDTCPDRIFGSTEGVMYRQRLTKQDVLLYWRKTVCKLMPLYFDSELKIHNVPVYRYNLSESVFERVTNGTDCYDTVPALLQGISDASKCYFDYPMVVSYPHFYTGGVPKDHYVTGLKPDRLKHNSYAVVEPFSGTPFYSVARMQSNLRIHDLSGFSSEYDKFSNLVIPLFWAEYSQEDLPPRIYQTIFFMVVILPPLSNICLTITLLLGFYLIIKHIYNYMSNDTLKTILLFKSKKVNNLAKNTIFSYEKESFLKRPS